MPRSAGCTPSRSGSWLISRAATAIALSSPNGGRPVAANAMTSAQANRSAAGPTGSPIACSGAM